MDIILQPIGIIHNDRTAIVDDNWGGVISILKLSDKLFSPDATLGLENFSHLEVIFYMDQVQDAKIETGARHPRNNVDLPLTGILAQRGKNRINKLGLSRAAIVAVNGLQITLQSLDAIDQTPVLDIKPYMREFAVAEAKVQQPEWVTALMSRYY